MAEAELFAKSPMDDEEFKAKLGIMDDIPDLFLNSKNRDYEKVDEKAIIYQGSIPRRVKDPDRERPQVDE